MTDDPRPWLRCRCAAYRIDGWEDEYDHRCPAAPTQEDGLCDHCRQPHGACSDPWCCDSDGSAGHGCCKQPYAVEHYVASLDTPCAAAGAEVTW